jgi:hypothetical protein
VVVLVLVATAAFAVVVHCDLHDVRDLERLCLELESKLA